MPITFDGTQYNLSLAPNHRSIPSRYVIWPRAGGLPVETHLAIALGREAIGQGYSALFIHAMAVVTSLVRAHLDGKLEQRVEQLANPKLLILGAFGYLSFEPAAGHLLFQLIRRRYERGSLVIMSNRAVGDSGAVLGHIAQVHRG